MDRMIHELDKDKDGYIDFIEFAEIWYNRSCQDMEARTPRHQPALPAASQLASLKLAAHVIAPAPRRSSTRSSSSPSTA